MSLLIFKIVGASSVQNTIVTEVCEVDRLSGTTKFLRSILEFRILPEFCPPDGVLKKAFSTDRKPHLMEGWPSG